MVRQISSRSTKWAGHVAHMGEERKLYKFVVERQRERTRSEDRHRWEDSNKMDRMGIGWESVEWIHFTCLMIETSDGLL
jgi:hypothetical protein